MDPDSRRLSKTDRAFFNSARAVSKLSDHHYKLGCVVVDRHRIISSGFNSKTKCHRVQAVLDGLAAGTVAIAASAFAVVSVLTGHGDLAYLCVAMAAACLAFLRFNAHPAKVFMGDTGSLALGGALAAVDILTHTEILLAVIGFVFVCEALSVIIQVISFQTTGKRVFRMSPIHHHFELGGWSEWKVVTVFWCVGLIASVAGLSLAAH